MPWTPSRNHLNYHHHHHASARLWLLLCCLLPQRGDLIGNLVTSAAEVPGLVFSLCLIHFVSRKLAFAVPMGAIPIPLIPLMAGASWHACVCVCVCVLGARQGAGWAPCCCCLPACLPALCMLLTPRGPNTLHTYHHKPPPWLSVHTAPGVTKYGGVVACMFLARFFIYSAFNALWALCPE